jgi:hypothetical protein
MKDRKIREEADEPIELEGITHWTEIMPPRKEE